MTDQGRVGAFALAELCGRFAHFALARDGENRVGAEALRQYAEFLLKSEALSQEELMALWQQNSDPILLLRGAREAYVEMAAELLSWYVRYAFLEALGRTGGVRLTPAAASRCLRRLERLEQARAPFTEEEIAELQATQDRNTFCDLAQLTSSLEQAVAGGRAEDAGRVLASLGCLLSHGLTYSFAMDRVCVPLFGRYAAAVGDAGFRGHRELAKMWNEEDGVAQPMRDACHNAVRQSATGLSHYLGTLAIDLLDRIDGVELTAAAAEQGLTMLKRVQEREEIVSEAERRRLDKVFAAELKGGTDHLKQELRQIAAAETVH